MKGLVAPETGFIEIDSFKSFTVIGDPGCDGLGAATMSVFAKALSSGQGDFLVVAGDLVPCASRQIYENVREFIDRVAGRPVYPLCGNHDTEFYGEYFGLRDYALFSPDATIIALDNSNRKFSDGTVAFFKEALERRPGTRVIVIFHIPAPNRFTSNSVSQEEWARLRTAYLPHKGRIDCFVCGHLHSFFEDRVDGIPLVVTGGGGARIESVNPEVDAMRSGNHVVDFSLSPDGTFKYGRRSLDGASYDKELADPVLKKDLEDAFHGECEAMFRYALNAEEAERAGMPWLARLFKALSHSEYHHAKNHHATLGKTSSPVESVRTGIRGESYEVETMYKDFWEYARAKGHGLAAYSFFDAWMAEKIHLGLLKDAEALLVSGKEPAKAPAFHTCSSCGYTFHMDGQASRCPVCGAPRDKIIPVP